MGRGAYSDTSYRAITDARATVTDREVFSQQEMNPLMNPLNVVNRESCDSDLHPESRAIMFVVDQTGSMQGIPKYLARTGLPELMRHVYGGGLITDPQVMIAAIGDGENGVSLQRAPNVGGELAPLQVGQFESEAQLMDKWLTATFLEGGGGGNEGESYGDAFYFAARHTKLDCWEKRGQKGYLFVSGDEPPLPYVRPEVVLRRIGDTLQQPIPVAEIVTEASEKYHCFFLIPDSGRASRCEDAWRPILGDRVIVQANQGDTAAVTAALIGLTEGTIANIEAVPAKLKDLGCDDAQCARVVRAVSTYAESLDAAPATQAKKPTGKPKAKPKGGKKKPLPDGRI